MLVDENAFGVLLSYFAVEDEEYGLDRGDFVARFQEFRSVLTELLAQHPPGKDLRVLDLGHAFYFEMADGDQTESPIAWTKRARATLEERGFQSVAVITHGSRWVEDDGDVAFLSTEHVGSASLVTLGNPSEPLRRALSAEALSRPDDEPDHEGWGVGTYLDVEAAEALKLSPKNAPTLLAAPGARFYRVAR